MAVTFLDTTLRDGAQGVGVNFTLQDKLDITKRLDDFGIDYIEGGFPMASPREAEYFQKAQQLSLRHAKLVAFGSTRRPNQDAQNDSHIQALLAAETPVAVIVGKGWDAHVNKVIGTDLSENLRMIEDSVRALKQHGKEVILDVEHFFDGYSHNPGYALQVLRCGVDAGADWVVLCDTNGGTLPQYISQVFVQLKAAGIPAGQLGIHCHNDTECAVACSLAAVEGGARHVHGTINGLGERCGNANLCSIIPNLVLKGGYHSQCNQQLQQLTSLSRYVSEKANLVPERNQPYVGDAAFGHKAGQHADVVLKDPILMEHIDSALLGNKRHMVVSELAGRASVLPLIQALIPARQYTKQSPEVSQLIEQIKHKEVNGYLYEAAEASLELEARKVLQIYYPLFELTNYHMEIFRTRDFQSQTVGRIFLRARHDPAEVSGQTGSISAAGCSGIMDLMGAGVGDGPVAALDAAIRNALLLKPLDHKNLSHFAFLQELSLVDYRVRVINPEDAVSARVRVVISTKSERDSITWDTVGVSENIVDASLEALKDSYDYYFNRYILK